MQVNNISVFGCACTDEHDELFKEVIGVTKLLAEHGYKITNGGGPGLMYAATHGAKDAKGETEVVYYEPKFASKFKGGASENIADKSSIYANYFDRTRKLIELGDIYLVLKGGTGTISEFGMVWGIAKLYFGHHKPVVVYGEFWNNIIKVMKENMCIRPEEIKVIKVAKDAKE